MPHDPLRLPIGSARPCLVALSHCGRIFGWTRADGDLGHEWARAMRLAGWQVGTMTHAELLASEPACTTCRFQRACFEARRCQVSA